MFLLQDSFHSRFNQWHVLYEVGLGSGGFCVVYLTGVSSFDSDNKILYLKCKPESLAVLFLATFSPKPGAEPLI